MVKRLLLAPIAAALLVVAMLPGHGLTQAGNKVTLQLKWVTQAQFADFVKAEVVKWGAVVKSSGARAD